MQLLAYIVPVLLGATLDINVGVSPDQPLPFSYTDDPVVFELGSKADIKAEISLHAEFPGAPVDFKAAPLALRADVPGLTSFQGLPNTRGLFSGALSITNGPDTANVDIKIARIERPTGAMPAPIPAYFHAVETVEQVIAARAAGANAISLAISHPKFAELVRAAAPMGVVPFVGAGERDAVAAITALPPDLIKLVVRWTIDPSGDVAVLQQITDAIRATPCKAPISVFVSDAATFEKMMADGADKSAHAAVLASDVTTGKEARLLLDAAERAGHEGWPLHVRASGAGGAEAPNHALQQVLANLAAGASSTGLSADLLYDGKSMGEAFVALNALGRRLAATEHAGNISLGSSVSAPLFRNGAHWLLAIWSEGTAKEVNVPADGAQDLQLSDAAGNPVALAPLKDGQLAVAVGHMPVLLSGIGGPLLGEAARNKSQNVARRLLEDVAMQRWLAPEIRALVQTTNERKGELDRPSILALLRALPELERLWHDGKLPRSAAVPAIADIARLCRNLSAVEEDKGQAYLEPMHDMLARSEEMQSIYLTGAGGGAEAHERGDWILNEVRRLIDEAKKLAAEDRKIEAAGVAALAEARAHALEFAAKEGEKSRLSEDEILKARGAAPAPAVSPAPAPAEPTPVKAEDAAAPPAGKEDAKPLGDAKPETKPDTKTDKKEEAQPTPKADEKLAPGQPKGTRKLMHTVERGDTPESIAKKYGADFEVFRKTNGLRAGATLRPGKQYVVYAPVKEAKLGKADAAAPAKDAPAAVAPAGNQPPNTKKVIHKVAKGDNPSIIAKKYGVSTEDFLKWNKLTERARFQIGEEYVVYVPTKR